MIDALTRDNPLLVQLEHDYERLNLFRHSQWLKHQDIGVNVRDFRADGAYLGQGALRGEAQYRNMFEYVKSIDREGYLDILQEDREFGVLTYEYPYKGGTKVVSRDLCDSVMELYFLRDTLGLPNDAPLRLLDIGSGYGRFAHRLTAAMPSAKVTCVDGVAVSTFLCEWYAQYRGFDDRTAVVPLTQLNRLNATHYDAACNIHSWSECSLATINFWLDKLVELRVPYLFLIPHDSRFVAVDPSGRIDNFRPLLDAHGYRLIAEQPKYGNTGIDGLYPEVQYYMFKLEGRQ